MYQKIHFTKDFKEDYNEDVESFQTIKKQVFGCYLETETQWFSIVPTVKKQNNITGEISGVFEPIYFVVYMKTKYVLMIQAFKGNSAIMNGEIMWFDTRNAKWNDVDESMWNSLLEKLNEFQQQIATSTETVTMSSQLVSTQTDGTKQKYSCRFQMFQLLLSDVIFNHKMAFFRYERECCKQAKESYVSNLENQVASLQLQLKQEQEKTKYLEELLQATN